MKISIKPVCKIYLTTPTAYPYNMFTDENIMTQAQAGIEVRTDEWMDGGVDG